MSALSERQQIRILKQEYEQQRNAVEQERNAALEQERNAALAVKKKAQKEKAKALLKESVKLAKQKKRDQEKRKKKKAKDKRLAKANDEKKEAPKAAPKAAPKKKASAKSKKKKNPTKTELRQEIRIILKTADLQTMTAKSVRKSLGIVFGCDLKPRKVEVTALIQECINEDDDEEEEEEEEEEEVVEKKPKKKRKTSSSSSSKSKSASKKKKSSQSKKRKRDNDKTKGGDSKKKKKDPNAPKRNKNGYMFFMADKRSEIKSANPEDSIGQIAKKVGAMWSALSTKDQKPYADMAAKDKVRYEKAKKAYEQKNGIAPKKKKDPNAPKRNKNGYMHFMADKRSEIISANPEDGIGQIAKKVGAMWSALSAKDQKPYADMAAKDKVRYEKAKKAYEQTDDYKKFAASN